MLLRQMLKSLSGGNQFIVACCWT